MAEEDSRCAAQFGDFDVYDCDLPVGHEGLHHDRYGLLWTMGDPSEPEAVSS